MAEWSLPLAARAGVVVAVCFAQLPSTVSHHSANLTCDPATAYGYLRAKAGRGEVVYHNNLEGAGEATSLEARRLSWDADDDLEKELAQIEASGQSSWFLLTASRAGVGSTRLEEWLSSHATLHLRLQARRFDYEVREVLLYRYTPGVRRNLPPR